MKQRTGICRECVYDVPLTDAHRINIEGEPPVDVWECPHCGYPNNTWDFHEIFDKEIPTKIMDGESEG